MSEAELSGVGSGGVGGDHGRMTELGVLTAGLLHELRQPLFVLKSCLDVLERDPDQIRQRMDDLRGQLRTMEALIEGYGDFSRPVGGERHAFDLRQPVRSALPVLERRARSAGVALRVEVAGIVVVGIPLAVQQAVVNLGNNAIEALSGWSGGRSDPVGRERGGQVTLRSEEREGGVSLWIEDDGPGLPEEIRRDPFQAFRTTKAGGTGLGLVLVREAVALSGGELRLREGGEGTGWEIRLGRV